MDKEEISYVMNVLRKGTTTWKGRTECLNRNRRQKQVGETLDGRPKYIWEKACEGCGRWFDQKDNMLEVDHIVEIGPFTGSWDDFVRRCYCGQDNLQALCTPCHAKKTSGFNATRLYERKKKDNGL